jgi:hypothetical protein
MSSAPSQTLDAVTIQRALSGMLPDLRARYQVSSLGMFGSYLRGEAHPDSDLDLLVEFDQPPSLLTFIALENEISDRLGLRVDLVMRRALKPRIGEAILREVVML